MANTDRPNGFRAVKTLNGSPVTQMVRTIGVADGADIFVGDALETASGLAQRFTVGDECLGVAVGFGKKDSMNQEAPIMANPAALETRFYDDSANTHTDWVCYYIPADNVVFEAQVDDTAATLTVGQQVDVLVGSGNTSTGLSDMEINGDATTGPDVEVVEIPSIVGNDHTAAYGRYWVRFILTEFAQATA